MYFCLNCGTMLQYELAGERGRFSCLICGYVACIQHKGNIMEEMDIIVSENDDLKRMPQADASCPNCYHGRAAFVEQQTRSADEPATLFFTCLKCKHKWNQ